MQQIYYNYIQIQFQGTRSLTLLFALLLHTSQIYRTFLQQLSCMEGYVYTVFCWLLAEVSPKTKHIYIESEARNYSGYLPIENRHLISIKARQNTENVTVDL
jgi:hypothetical protein